MISPAAAIADPQLLGPSFSGTSWDTWRAVLKAAYGEPLSDTELALFKTVAGDRDPPQRQVRELIVIAGRRSGKDSIASAIATTAAIADYSPFLRPGERASVLCLACDREQSKIVSRYITGYFNTVPLLKPLLERETNIGIELNNGVEVVVATNSFRATRGRTIACAIFDEASFWRDDSYQNPDIEVYNAVMPSLVTLPGAILIIITTAYRRAGLAYSKWQSHYAQNDDDVLVIYAKSTDLNPLLPQYVIDAAIERDPEAANAEWNSVWRSDLAAYLDRQLIESAVDPGITVRPRVPRQNYIGFADPSGGRADSFTCAVAHLEGDQAILDALFEQRPPFNPSQTVADIARFLEAYGLGSVTGDMYAAGWVTEAFAREGLRYEYSERDRSALYQDCITLFTSGRARILDHPRLVHQFASLERRTSPVGRDRIDHGPGGHDDLCNSAAGALVGIANDPLDVWRRLMVN